MNRKGISPIIAAVFLIGFTMAIVGLFAGFVPDAMPKSNLNYSQSIEAVDKVAPRTSTCYSVRNMTDRMDFECNQTVGNYTYSTEYHVKHRDNMTNKVILYP